MVKIRLSLVLFVYGVLVIIGLVGICVAFTLMHNVSTEEMARELLETIMGHNVRFLKKSLRAYERITRKMGVDLIFFNFTARTPPDLGDLPNYLSSWNAFSLMLLPHTHVIELTEMWSARPTSIEGKNESEPSHQNWSISSCEKKTESCNYYHAESNKTVILDKWTQKKNLIQSLVRHKDGLSKKNQRKVEFLDSIEHRIPSEGIWSPMYIDFVDSTSPVTRMCGDRLALFTMSYYYCIDDIKKADSNFRFVELPDSFKSSPPTTSAKLCKHVVSATIEGIHMGEEAGLGISKSSQSFILALNLRDSTGGACRPNSKILEIKDKFIERCVQGHDTHGLTCAECVFTCKNNLEINKKYITVAERVVSSNGIRLVLVNIIERSHFFSQVDKCKMITIAISIAVTVGLFIVCILLHAAICVPIHWICRGMHDASRLSSENDPMLKRAARYTIIAEVAQLFVAYLNLRRALRELKAFVPQGLFVASTTARKQSDSPMFTLFGHDELAKAELGGSFASSILAQEEEEENALFPEDVHAPFGKFNSELSLCPSPCDLGYSYGCDLNVLASPNELPAGPGHAIPRAAAAQSPTGEGLEGKPRKGKTFPCFCCSSRRGSAADHATTTTTAIAIGSEAVDGPSPANPPPISRNGGRSEGEAGRRKTEGVVAWAAPTAPGDSLDDAGSASTPTLWLNMMETRRSNRFRLVTCSFIMIASSYRYINPERVESEVAGLMDVLVREVLVCGGVLEVFRPDFILISFGAHSILNRHEQMALLCAAKVMGELPGERRRQTRVLVDSGLMYVGNCGAHKRTARVVFGDRLTLAITFLHHELGSGRILLTDHIAVSLPASFVAPVDHIIPLRAQAASVQLFQLLNPALSREAPYAASAASFRQAFAAAIGGDYAAALGLANGAAAHDAEVCRYFTRALECLAAATPPRPRYCRFQLPAFEPLGTLRARPAATFTYEKLSLEKIRVAGVGAGAPLIGFGFESASSLSGLFREAGEAGEAEKGPAGIPRTVVDGAGTAWHLLPRPVDAGAFGAVYKAISAAGAVMALKCIDLDAHRVRLADVVREVNTACKLFNEAVVNYTGWAHVGGFVVIIMDYVAGGSLQGVLPAFPGGMPVRLVKRYGSDALKGLAYLHAHHVVHADIKPGNILVAVDGGCKLSDFGSSVSAARAARARAKAPPTQNENHENENDKDENEDDGVFGLRGTARYMSPEVARGATPSPASDVWSLGLTLHEMLTGRLPWAWAKTKGGGGHESGRGGKDQKGTADDARARPPSPRAFSVDPLEVIEAAGEPASAPKSGPRESWLSNSEQTFLRRLLSSTTATTLAPGGDFDSGWEGDTNKGNPQDYRGRDAAKSHRNSTCEKAPDGETPAPGPWLASQAFPPGSFGRDARGQSSTIRFLASQEHYNRDHRTSLHHDLPPISNISDVRFVQGLVKGTIEVQLHQSDFPSMEAFSLVSSCLCLSPSQRPSPSELLGHPFFIL